LVVRDSFLGPSFAARCLDARECIFTLEQRSAACDSSQHTGSPMFSRAGRRHLHARLLCANRRSIVHRRWERGLVRRRSEAPVRRGWRVRSKNARHPNRGVAEDEGRLLRNRDYRIREGARQSRRFRRPTRDSFLSIPHLKAGVMGAARSRR
jgi:hypothetical protein